MRYIKTDTLLFQYGFVCVVTGATQPVGQAAVSELAGTPSLPGTSLIVLAKIHAPSAHGAACIYSCTSPAETLSEKLASTLHTTHPNTKIIPYPLHVSDEQSTLSLIDDVLNTWGRLDVWVSSSGLLGPPSIDLTTPTDLQKCFEANSVAPFLALKYAPPAMGKLCSKGNYPNAAVKDRAYGSIIVISSVASIYGGFWGPACTMSSHAALGAVRAGVTVLKGLSISPFSSSPSC